MGKKSPVTRILKNFNGLFEAVSILTTKSPMIKLISRIERVFFISLN